MAGFWYGPAICRVLVVKEVHAGALSQAVSLTLTALHKGKGHVRLAEIPVVVVEHSLGKAHHQANLAPGCGLPKSQLLDQSDSPRRAIR